MPPASSCWRPAGWESARCRSGALGFSTFKLQLVVRMAAAASPNIDHRSVATSRSEFMSASSVGDFDDGRQGPELGILEPVHPDLERIAEEARDFRIEP